MAILGWFLKIFCSEIRKTERFVILDVQIGFFTPKKAIYYYSLFGLYHSNIRIILSKSDRISNWIPLFGNQLLEYSNNSNYLFKLWSESESITSNKVSNEVNGKKQSIGRQISSLKAKFLFQTIPTSTQNLVFVFKYRFTTHLPKLIVVWNIMKLLGKTMKFRILVVIF